MSKGSVQRPAQVPNEVVQKNWDRIFKKNFTKKDMDKEIINSIILKDLSNKKIGLL